MTQETTHTPEPWIIHKWSKTTVTTGQERTICTTSNYQSNVIDQTEINLANADRIVACVNACEGMADPAAEIAALKAQRDELLWALKVCSASLFTYGSHPIIEKQVKNAINKTKGGRP